MASASSSLTAMRSAPMTIRIRSCAASCASHHGNSASWRCRGHGASSRRHTSRTVPNIMDVNPQAVVAAFRAGGVRRIIHGHTHRPGVHDLEVDGKAAQRIVLGAWYEQGSVLRYQSGRYELRT